MDLAGITDMEIGKVLTANLDLKQRIGMGFTLANIVNAPLRFKRAIKTVQKALLDEDLIHRRNQAVHGIHFETGIPGAAGIEMHRGKGGRSQRIQYDTELHGLGTRLKQFDDHFLPELLTYIRERHPQAVAGQPLFETTLAIAQKQRLHEVGRR